MLRLPTELLESRKPPKMPESVVYRCCLVAMFIMGGFAVMVIMEIARDLDDLLGPPRGGA